MKYLKLKNNTGTDIFLTDFGQQQIAAAEVVEIPESIIHQVASTQLQTLVSAGSIQILDQLSVAYATTKALNVIAGVTDSFVAGGNKDDVIVTDASGALVWLPKGTQKLQDLYKLVPQLITIAAMPATIALPTITDGTALVSLDITPVEADSVIKIKLNSMIELASNDLRVVFCIFRGNTLVHIFVSSRTRTNQLSSVVIDFMDAARPAGTTPLTYSVRVGTLYGLSSLYVNVDGANGYYLGGFDNNKIELTEIKKSTITEVL